MKSTPEPYENELRQRLRLYQEEPDKKLWGNIAPRIVSGAPGLIWPSISTVIVGLSLVIQGHLPGTGMQTAQLIAVNGRQDTMDCMLMEDGNSTGKNQILSIPYEVRNPAPKNRDSYNMSTDEQKSFADQVNQTTSSNVSWRAGNPAALGGNEIREVPFHRSYELPHLVTPENVRKETRVVKKVTLVKAFSLKGPTMYFSVMPTLGYQKTEANVYDQTLIESVSIGSATSARRLGVRFDAGFEWPVGNRVKVYSGLSYYRQNQTINYTEKHLDNTVIEPGSAPGQITVVPVYSYIDKSIQYEINNLGVQVGLLYRLSRNKDRILESELLVLAEPATPAKRRFAHWVGAGIEFQKALNKTSEANGFYNPTSYVFGNMYYRLQFPNTGKFKVNLQPTFFYSLYVNQNSNSTFFVRPFGFGLSLGCSFKI